MMSSYLMHHVEFFDYTPKPINCLAFCHKSKRLAVARFDANGTYIEIWNSRENWLLEQILPATTTIECMVWFKKKLILGGLNGDLMEVDLKGCAMKKPVPSNYGAIWCLCVNEEGSLIAAGTEEGCVVLFEVDQEEEIVYRKAVVKQEARILSICWHTQLNLLLTGSSDVRVYEAGTGALVQRISVASSKNNLVWALAVTRDFTIISGDSSGQTAFWYGVPGKLSHSKRFRSHEADIHSIVINYLNNLACVAGIDGITMFRLDAPYSRKHQQPPPPSSSSSSSSSASSASSSSSSWVMAGKKVYHSNDVRALQFVKNYSLASAGLDCQLIINDKLEKKLTRISCTQQRKLVQTHQDTHCILFQYERSVELWRLGDAEDGEATTDSHHLPLLRNEMKLLNIRSDSFVSCACIGTCDKMMVAFSNDKSTAVYAVDVKDLDSKHPVVKATTIQCPASFIRTPSIHLAIGGSIIASVSRVKVVTFVDLHFFEGHDGGNVDPVNDGGCKKGKVGKDGGVMSTYQLPVNSSIQCICFNSTNDNLSIACVKFGVTIVDVRSGQILHHLPRRDRSATSLSFHPHLPNLLLVSYSDGLISEFDTSTETHTAKSRSWLSKHHNSFITQLNKKHISTILRVFYDVTNEGRVVCQHDVGFSVLHWGKVSENTKEKCLNPFKFYGTHNLHHIDILKDNTLVLVEQNDIDLILQQAPSFKKHKFGV